MTVGQNEGRPYPTTTGGEMTDIDVMRELIESQRREIERLRRGLSYRVHTDEDIEVQNKEIERLEAALRAKCAGHQMAMGDLIGGDCDLCEVFQAEIKRLEDELLKRDIIFNEAKAEIERLQTELARIRGLPRLAALDDRIRRLEAALRDALTLSVWDDDHPIVQRARAALEGK